MVYINDTSGTITIPRHTFNIHGNYTLILTSNMANDVVLVDNQSNISTNTLYYKFALDNLTGLNVGEYNYTLNGVDDEDEECILETGLLTFGNYTREVPVNNTFEKQKIQYNG